MHHETSDIRRNMIVILGLKRSPVKSRKKYLSKVNKMCHVSFKQEKAWVQLVSLLESKLKEMGGGK